MDPDERTTNTEDEQRDLIGTVYHALQQADACERHAREAEKRERLDLLSYFREARASYVRTAQRGKALLGIAGSETEPGDLPPHSADVQAAYTPPRTSMPQSPSRGADTGAAGSPAGESPEAPEQYAESDSRGHATTIKSMLGETLDHAREAGARWMTQGPGPCWRLPPKSSVAS